MSQSDKSNFFFEKKFWIKGFKYIAGVDEVGRGCFAGPVIAACVVFKPQIQKGLALQKRDRVVIDDSKKLTSKQREKAEKWIKENAEVWGIGEASAKVINRLGMAAATRIAFRKAVLKANQRFHNKIDYLLIDAFFVPYIRGFPKGRVKTKGSKSPKYKDGARQLAIINGDEKSISIAAASIIAKVYRDSLMEKIGRRARYKKYDWINNKGYATKRHQEAILKYGITGYHRRRFVKTFLQNL